MIADTPELRIVDDEVWAKVQLRRSDRSGERHYATRPRRLFSGLLKCGCCGSGYVVSGRDKRGTYLRCSRMIETGLCDNRRTVGLNSIEDKVLQGIEQHLTSPDLLAEYVREYHRAYTELRDTTARRRADLTKRLAELKTQIKRAVAAVMENPRSKAVQAQLRELEDQGDEIEAALDNIEPPPTIELHPKVGEIYRRKVRDLKTALTRRTTTIGPGPTRPFGNWSKRSSSSRLALVSRLRSKFTDILQTFSAPRMREQSENPSLWGYWLRG